LRGILTFGGGGGAIRQVLSGKKGRIISPRRKKVSKPKNQKWGKKPLFSGQVTLGEAFDLHSEKAGKGGGKKFRKKGSSRARKVYQTIWEKKRLTADAERKLFSVESVWKREIISSVRRKFHRPFF